MTSQEFDPSFSQLLLFPEVEECICRLYEFERIEWVKRLNGFSSLNLQFRAGDRHWLLKQYGELAKKRSNEMNDLITLLEAQHFPFAAPVINKFGVREFQLRENTYAIYPIKPGRVFHRDELTEITLRNLAPLIARFHSLGSQYTSASYASSPKNAFSMAEFHCKAQTLTQKLDSTYLEPHIVESLNESLAIRRHFLEQIPQNCDEFLALEQGGDLIHGDFHNENVLFNESREPTCLLDFEEYRMGHRIIDLINFIQLALFSSDFTDAQMRLGRYFLKIYSDHNNLNNTQIAQGIHHNFSLMATSLFFEFKLSDGADPIFLDLIRRDLKKLKFYQKHHQSLVEALLI